MVDFQPLETEQPAAQRFFEDHLPMYETTVSVSKRKVQIVEFLAGEGAQSPLIIDGMVGDRPAWQVTFIWRIHPVRIVVAALPFRRRRPTKRQVEQAKKQTLATLHEYLRFTANIRSFLPDFEPFAAYMLPPGGQVNESIGAVVHRLLDQDTGYLALPEPPGRPDVVFIPDSGE
jgi:hypothetical protein